MLLPINSQAGPENTCWKTPRRAAEPSSPTGRSANIFFTGSTPRGARRQAAGRWLPAPGCTGRSRLPRGTTHPPYIGYSQHQALICPGADADSEDSNTRVSGNLSLLQGADGAAQTVSVAVAVVAPSRRDARIDSAPGPSWISYVGRVRSAFGESVPNVRLWALETPALAAPATQKPVTLLVSAPVPDGPPNLRSLARPDGSVCPNLRMMRAEYRARAGSERWSDEYP